MYLMSMKTSQCVAQKRITRPYIYDVGKRGRGVVKNLEFLRCCLGRGGRGEEARWDASKFRGPFFAFFKQS